jgi:hypothetical protein
MRMTLLRPANQMANKVIRGLVDCSIRATSSSKRRHHPRRQQRPLHCTGGLGSENFPMECRGKGRLAGIACGEPIVTAPIHARPIEAASQGRRLNGDARMAALAPVVLVACHPRCGRSSVGPTH